jgi:hypothetical protein
MSPLFEDELYDSGVSHLLVRIVRPSPSELTHPMPAQAFARL